MKPRIFTVAHTAAVCLMAVSGTLAAATVSNSGELPPGAFSNGNLEGWTERSFEGNTRYELVEDNGVSVLKGHTENQASIFYREQNIDLMKTPVINWSWKVNGVFEDIDEQSREGDDFPARLYVVVKTGFLPWQTLAINYVWASQLPIGNTWPNPYTDKAQMVAIQSGGTFVNSWTHHSRNVAEDFKQLFDKDISEIQGFAVMVDGDNSMQEATAWFGQISFSNEVSPPNTVNVDEWPTTHPRPQ